MAYQHWGDNEIHATFTEIHYLINLITMTQNRNEQYSALNQLWNKTSYLRYLVQLLQHQSRTVGQPITEPENPIGQTFTIQQLGQFTGMNGKPAYVAVNGVVYDVTNNAAWSAASHFGLTAGKDLTTQFASCHPGQQWILAQLKPIGGLVP